MNRSSIGRTGYAILLWIVVLSGITTSGAIAQTTSTQSSVPVLDIKGLQQLIKNTGKDTLLVINFWATWCKPCVEELPIFFHLKERFSDKAVKVVLVSLDAVKRINGVEQFIKDKKVPVPVYVLDAGDPNVWIDKINKTWQGTLPATAVYKGGHAYKFTEGQLEEKDIDKIVRGYVGVSK